MSVSTPADLLQPDYASDRAAFIGAVERFAQHTGRKLRLHTHPLDREPELCVTAAELLAERPERLYLLTTGVHGIEGYAGSAIARRLLSGLLPRLDPEHTSVVVLHALNPYGLAHFQRVNANNVDLNRNCQGHAEDLFSTDSSAFSQLVALLAPKHKCTRATAAKLRFMLGLLHALRRHGAPVLRQASLSGQYVDPQAIFFGGVQVEPEIAFFQTLYEAWVRRHGEILLTDLHTGYGTSGHAYPLFGRADSPQFRAFTELGVSDDGGRDQAYTVHGDLIGYCYKTAKRVRPAAVFNGLVVEIGTGGLGVLDQIRDLYTVVRENQLRNHGAVDAATEELVRARFKELFCPSSEAWRAQAVRAGALAVERLLEARGYLRSGSG